MPSRRASSVIFSTSQVSRFTFHAGFPPHLFHLPDIQAVELLADLEEEHAEDDHADEDVEGNSQFDYHRHAVGGAGGGEEQAVFHRQEGDDLRHRLAARDHHQEGEQHAGEGDAERRARDGARQLRDRLRR